jgi:hypothetical protein
VAEAVQKRKPIVVRQPRLDPHRIVNSTVMDLDGIASALKTAVELGVLDADLELQDWWADSFRESMREISRLMRKLLRKRDGVS